ncbi:hypothetical protein [Desulfonema magnum]|uniref:Uncharacterized protein n=1 Tax=Desulfonema magnum TaxID=45655 RepID=A0A975GPC0_9BACT|nr:hypothetical protein [Desulfonema magnum]QTA88679.1 Uncharacterized protein dnm_047260 [Desulfonema magnum]
MSKKSIASMVVENKTVFIVIAIALFLIELEIFAVAAMKSGWDYKMQILDDKGNLIHETDGKNLSDFNKYYFEKTHGPFEQYQRKLVKNYVPFPFRAWFVAAVGIPVGVILLFAFVVRAYIALFYGEEKEEEADLRKENYGTRLEKIIASVSGFNIFAIGFLVFLVIISYWIIPEVVIYLGKLGEDTILKYKWFFLAVLLAAFGILVWITYLRYLLAKKTIDSQTEVDKFRMQLEFKQTGGLPLQLEYDHNEINDKPLLGWDDKKNNITGNGDTPPSKSEKPKKSRFFKKN